MPNSEGPVVTTETRVSKLDPSNPLYLHPSDSSNLTIVNIKLNGTENYTVWSNSMTLALNVKNKLGFVDGTCVRPLDDDVLGKQWDRCNSVVLTWILNSVSEELYLGQVYSTLASSVWTELKETYDKLDGSVIFDLYQNINSFSQNGMSVADYYHKLNVMWKKLDQILQIPPCVCNASKKFNDFSLMIKLMQFLMGLDNVYQPVRTTLLTREELPTVKEAFALISREESHRNSNSNSQKGQTQAVGFVSKTNQSFDSKRKNPRTLNQNLKCTHCDKIGHTADKCFEIIGYPSWMKPRNNQLKKPGVSNNASLDNNNNGTCSSNVFTADQVSRLLSLLNDKSNGGNQSCNSDGLTNKECPGDW